VFSVWYIIFTYGSSRTCSVPCFSLLLFFKLLACLPVHSKNSSVLYLLSESSLCLGFNVHCFLQKPSLYRSLSSEASTSVLFNLTYNSVITVVPSPAFIVVTPSRVDRESTEWSHTGVLKASQCWILFERKMLYVYLLLAYNCLVTRWILYFRNSFQKSYYYRAYSVR